MRLIIVPFIFTLILFPFFAGNAEGQSNSRYLGTGSCSSSNCHGSVMPKKGSNVLQNEYLTWLKHDAHSNAWLKLTEPDAKKIGEHLGIADPSKDKLCLDCHATNVEEGLRGEKYTIQDGVSCESCHGPAEKWLEQHVEKGSTHKKNIEHGMHDLVPLETRAENCLACHYGTSEKSVTHRLIGAGHPRLSFELDTFSMIQPKHWEYDEDYVQRKGSYDSVRSWLLGQVVLALETLEVLRSETRSRDGIFPELTLFNCYACHHSLTTEDWKSREYRGQPGELRLNLSSLLTVKEAMKILMPQVGERLEKIISDLHIRYKKGDKEPLQELVMILDSEVKPFAKGYLAKTSEAQLLIDSLFKFIATSSYFHYEEAEQLAMGISAIAASSQELLSQYKPRIDKLYQALRSPKEFRSEEFTGTAGSLPAN